MKDNQFVYLEKSYIITSYNPSYDLDPRLIPTSIIHTICDRQTRFVIYVESSYYKGEFSTIYCNKIKPDETILEFYKRITEPVNRILQGSDENREE